MNKNKYYDLILAMMKNRGDWSNGFNYVKTALMFFEAETEEDKEIAKELHEFVYNDEYIDGRIFRDCKYNYNYLIEKFLTKEEKDELEKEWNEWF